MNLRLVYYTSNSAFTFLGYLMVEKFQVLLRTKLMNWSRDAFIQLLKKKLFCVCSKAIASLKIEFNVKPEKNTISI